MSEINWHGEITAPRPGITQRPPDYKSDALPIEPKGGRQMVKIYFMTIFPRKILIFVSTGIGADLFAGVFDISYES